MQQYINLLTSVTSNGVERAIKLSFEINVYRSTMGEDALILTSVNNDIIEEIIDIFATKPPRRMLLLNPLF